MYHNSILYHYETWSILFISTVHSLSFCGFSVQVSPMKLHPSTTVSGRVPFLQIFFKILDPGDISTTKTIMSASWQKNRGNQEWFCVCTFHFVTIVQAAASELQWYFGKITKCIIHSSIHYTTCKCDNVQRREPGLSHVAKEHQNPS